MVKLIKNILLFQLCIILFACGNTENKVATLKIKQHTQKSKLDSVAIKIFGIALKYYRMIDYNSQFNYSQNNLIENLTHGQANEYNVSEYIEKSKYNIVSNLIFYKYPTIIKGTDKLSLALDSSGNYFLLAGFENNRFNSIDFEDYQKVTQIHFDNIMPDLEYQEIIESDNLEQHLQRNENLKLSEIYQKEDTIVNSFYVYLNELEKYHNYKYYYLNNQLVKIDTPKPFSSMKLY